MTDGGASKALVTAAETIDAVAVSRATSFRVVQAQNGTAVLSSAEVMRHWKPAGPGARGESPRDSHVPAAIENLAHLGTFTI